MKSKYNAEFEYITCSSTWFSPLVHCTFISRPYINGQTGGGPRIFKYKWRKKYAQYTAISGRLCFIFSVVLYQPYFEAFWWIGGKTGYKSPVDQNLGGRGCACCVSAWIRHCRQRPQIYASFAMSASMRQYHCQRCYWFIFLPIFPTCFDTKVIHVQFYCINIVQAHELFSC